MELFFFFWRGEGRERGKEKGTTEKGNSKRRTDDRIPERFRFPSIRFAFYFTISSVFFLTRKKKSSLIKSFWDFFPVTLFPTLSFLPPYIRFPSALHGLFGFRKTNLNSDEKIGFWEYHHLKGFSPFFDAIFFLFKFIHLYFWLLFQVIFNWNWYRWVTTKWRDHIGQKILKTTWARAEIETRKSVFWSFSLIWIKF